MPDFYSTFVVFDWDGNIICRDRIPYDGPWELCDRSLNAAGKNAASTATSVGTAKGADASQVGANLIPGLEQEAKGGQGYTPTEMNNQLVAGEQGAGGANSGITGQANLEAARTRNAGGFAGALDEAARDKGRTLSQNALGVANKSADLGEKKQQFAQGELGSIYGTDTNAMLHAMGLVPEDINAAANSQKVGWMQNFNQIMQDLKPSGSAGGGNPASIGFGG